MLGATVGYSGTLPEAQPRRQIWLTGLAFMGGTMFALAALGAATGFISQAVGASLGVYWKLFAGSVMVLFGLATLNLLPFTLPRLGMAAGRVPDGAGKAMVYGLALGGGSTACSTGCNPVLPVVLGVVALQGHMLWGAAILATFAFGYSLPLTGGLLGLGLGIDKLTTGARRFLPIVRRVAGALLLIVGFYLLATA